MSFASAVTPYLSGFVIMAVVLVFVLILIKEVIRVFEDLKRIKK